MSPLLYTWYGDDFTGSTDVLERLALEGVPAVLFTHEPAADELQRYGDCRAVGIAGQSRSQTPVWMSKHLPEVFALLRVWNAPVCHYKVCSTFDSGPHVGSIGRAMELGKAAFDAEFVPVVVGAPHLGRAVVYSQLFAAAQGTMHRIDRHPTMSRHPVTPMREADLRVHLYRQTMLRMGAVDLTAYQQGRVAEQLAEELRADAEAVIFDGCDDQMTLETARVLWQRAQKKPLFAVGSSGLTYGLLQHWRETGLIAAAPNLTSAAPVDRVVVLSGSCSPVTERQILRARQMGFTTLEVDARGWSDELTGAAEAALAANRSVVLFTALGPQPASQAYGENFSATLGERLKDLLLRTNVRRVVVAGGDTSTHAVQQLGLQALSFAAPLAPGAPLCKAHSPGTELDGLELVLKGGQIGPDEFFAQVRG
jgi:uncharacterized protein YgbK (DUF1537 family)